MAEVFDTAAAKIKREAITSPDAAFAFVTGRLKGAATAETWGPFLDDLSDVAAREGAETTQEVADVFGRIAAAISPKRRPKESADSEASPEPSEAVSETETAAPPSAPSSAPTSAPSSAPPKAVIFNVSTPAAPVVPTAPAGTQCQGGICYGF